jgi:hypothetical protein
MYDIVFANSIYEIKSYLRFCPKQNTLRYPTFPSTISITYPGLRKIQAHTKRPCSLISITMFPRSRIRQIYAHLTIANLPLGTTILPLNTYTVPPLFDQTDLINDERSFLIPDAIGDLTGKMIVKFFIIPGTFPDELLNGILIDIHALGYTLHAFFSPWR